jgi:hypothetical protein
LREYINLKYKQTTECIDAIYNIVTNGLKAGGIEPTEIKIYAVMQQRNIEDFDGHAREIFNMNTSQFSFKPPANKIQLTAKKGFCYRVVQRNNTRLLLCSRLQFGRHERNWHYF